ncbi:uncharacterized protein LOC114929165 [Nylanderia fulva]|uniref:uncharacterized protein LOC114929165 n=1 Tax=Nylanderia fulva TaxID=613905 RepID=UPI0010FB8AF3|nr:uncharacterized protein LOC114929165 [Nylanderia fulva]
MIEGAREVEQAEKEKLGEGERAEIESFSDTIEGWKAWCNAGLARKYFSELDPNFNDTFRAVDSGARKLVGMERRSVILTAVFGTVAALAILIALALAMWHYLRKKSKQRDDDLEDQNENGDGSSQQQPTKKNGFLNLKTPLISTKALG